MDRWYDLKSPPRAFLATLTLVGRVQRLTGRFGNRPADRHASAALLRRAAGRTLRHPASRATRRHPQLIRSVRRVERPAGSHAPRSTHCAAARVLLLAGRVPRLHGWVQTAVVHSRQSHVTAVRLAPCPRQAAHATGVERSWWMQCSGASREVVVRAGVDVDEAHQSDPGASSSYAEV